MIVEDPEQDALTTRLRKRKKSKSCFEWILLKRNGGATGVQALQKSRVQLRGATGPSRVLIAIPEMPSLGHFLLAINDKKTVGTVRRPLRWHSEFDRRSWTLRFAWFVFCVAWPSTDRHLPAPWSSAHGLESAMPNNTYLYGFHKMEIQFFPQRHAL